MRPRPTPSGVPTRVVCAGPEVEGPGARDEDSSPPRRPANYPTVMPTDPPIDGLGLALARAFRESA